MSGIDRAEAGLHDRYRKLKANAMVGLCVLALAVAVIPLGAILFMVAAKGLSAISWTFLTSLPNPPMEGGGGVRNAIVGTAVIVLISTVISVPIGVGAGVYLAEYGGSPVSRSIRFLTEVLSGLPSIIAGVVIYGLIVVQMRDVSAFAGGVALSLLSIPWVTVATEDALGLVPESYRDASLALGVDRTTTITSVVLPSAVGGIVTGTMLAVARVAGETAPLLWTVGNTKFGFAGILHATATLSVDIYLYATSPYESWHNQAWGAALLLVTFILLTNVVTRTLWSRRQRATGGE